MPFVAAIVVLVVIGSFVLAARARRRLEARADLLDLLASACRRGAPLPTILGATMQPDEGATLAETLESLGRHRMPTHVVAAIRAAEGTSRLPAVLESVATDTGEVLALRHRLRLAATYPVLLTVLVISLHVMITSWIPAPSDAATPAALTLVLTLATAVGLLLLLDRVGRLPGTRGLATARALQTGGLLLEAGLPLPEAFKRAAASAGHRGVERRLLVAARAVEEGGDAAALWSALPLPAADRVRIAAAGARLPEAVQEAAERATARWKLTSEGWLRWIEPAAVLVVGAMVFVDFRFVISYLEGAFAETHRGVFLW